MNHFVADVNDLEVVSCFYHGTILQTEITRKEIPL